jgi:hypothetical protein
MPTNADLPASRALAVMAVPKYCDAHLQWEIRKNQANILLATAQPEDETGALIPGITIQLEIKRPIVADRCLYELGLFQLEDGIRRRAYQLNVCPLNKRSHNDRQTGQALYGPHEHVGDSASAIVDQAIRCGALEVAFELFCSRINLSFTGHLNSPL